MKITFYGGAGTVTGSCFLVSAASTEFLVDCGMFQGSKELKELNYNKFMFDPKSVDFLLLTHAHVDHSGLIPKLYKHGFRGPTYTTKATMELCGVVLPDSGHIQEMEVERKNRKNLRSGLPLLEPIYTVQDAQKCLEYFKGVSYEEEISPVPGIRVRFQDAGHILGSAIIEVYITEDGRERKIVFSGDLGNIGQPILDDPTHIEHTDVLVMEATYGNRYHLNADNKLEELAAVVKSAMKKGGNLVVPSFAVERTQELVYNLKVLMDEGKIPPVQIYVDSPMAVEATRVFIRCREFFTDEAFAHVSAAEATAFFEFPNLHYVLTAEESMQLNKLKGGAVIISASGMADAGRIKHHLKHNLWRQESTVLFIGYQAEGTLGRRILEGEKKVRIHGEDVAVRADIARIEGFSGHADQKGLVEWVKSFQNEQPEQIYLVHGEGAALEDLQRVILSETGLQAVIPSVCSEYDFTEEKPQEACRIAAPVYTPAKSGVNEAFEAIKEQIEKIARLPGKDVRTLQRLLAQINEIERELDKVG